MCNDISSRRGPEQCQQLAKAWLGAKGSLAGGRAGGGGHGQVPGHHGSHDHFLLLPSLGGPWPLELLHRSLGSSWAIVSGSGALRGAGLCLPELGADPIPPGPACPAPAAPAFSKLMPDARPGFPVRQGAGFVFPASVWLLARVSPGMELGLSFWLPSAPPPPSRPCHGCHLLSPCHVPGTLPTCSRRVLVTALGAGDPLPPSPVQTLESTCPVAMLPRAALCLGHCYCHFRVTVPRVAGEAGRGPARERPGSWKEVSLLPRGPRTVGAGGSPGVAGRGVAGCPGGEGWP